MKALNLSKPHAIILIGIPGSGKTTFAKRFADTFQAVFVNMKLFLSYAPDSSAHDTMSQELYDIAFSNGQTVLVEAGEGTRTERIELAKRARAKGYEPLFVWVQIDPAAARLRATRSTRQTAALMSDEQFERDLQRFSPPHPTEKYIVISGMHTYASQAKNLLKHLTAGVRPALSTPDRPTPQLQRPVVPTEPVRRSVKIL